MTWIQGPVHFWQNSMPRLQHGEVPFGSLNESGELIITEIEQNEFLQSIPSDGYTTQVVLREDRKASYLTLILGVMRGVAIETWPNYGNTYRIGCKHELKERNSPSQSSRGNHHYACGKCGFEYYLDSGD